MPTLNGLACATDTQKASIVCPDSVRPLRSVMVTEIISGRRTPRLLEHLLDRDDAGLRVERVDDRLEQEQIAAAVDQAADLLAVRLAQLVEGHVAERRVVDVGRDRQDAVGRAHRAGDEARAVGRARGPLVGRRPRQPRALDVQLVDERLEPVVGLRDPGAVEACWSR